MVKKFAWSTMTLLALGVAAYAGVILISPTFRTPFVQNLFAHSPSAIAVHLAGGLVAIVLGAFQLNSWLRNRYLSVHRWLGRMYVLAVAIGGTAGLILAINSYGGLVTHFGFGLMAVCWLGTTLTAYLAIRKGDVQAHRAWMLRSYAVTLAGVTLRIYLGLSVLLDIEFDNAYPALSWLCWVPNLLVVEWFLLSRPNVMPKGPVQH